jgi:TRAP-type C4-dicarboxylate transport system substrate-binding protein
MRRNTVYFQAIFVIMAFVFFQATPIFAKTLRMSSWFPAANPLMTEGFVPWTEEIEKVTEGRVKVRIMKKTVGSVPTQFDVAMKGQVDIAFGNQSYSPGRFKQYAFVELPGNGDSSEATSVAFWRTYNRFFAKTSELGGVKLLGLFTHGPGQLFTTNHKVTSMDGNKGVKVRGGGVAATRVVEALGMTSIQAPFSKAAEMISNGVVDGAMFDRSIVPLVGFTRYFKNRFTIKGGLYNVSYFVVMNKKSWDALSSEDQAAIDAISGEAFARSMGAVWDRIGQSADKEFDKIALTTTTASGAFVQELQTVFKNFEKEWIDSVSKDGIDGQKVIDAYRKEIATLQAE